MPMPEEVPATPDAAPQDQKKETSDDKKEVNYEPAVEGATEIVAVEQADDAVATLAGEVDHVVAAPVVQESAPIVQDNAAAAVADPADVAAEEAELVAITESAAPIAPSPDDLFPARSVRPNPQPIAPVAPKPVRARPFARLGAVLPTSGALTGARPAAK